jgi:predicted Rossmann fold nucleotide-binding protein DprA/Smf involved in DNA uptake
MGDQYGPNNPNWKGGRTVASNGYVLIKDRDNPMADVRGYVYEHRRVIADEIGRPLTSTEQVHHEDQIKVNNAVENLELCASIAHHRLRHRRRNDLRMPGEPNPTVACACGCGREFDRYDSSGRPRQFLPGHNPMPAPTTTAIIGALADGPKLRRDLIAAVGLSEHTVATAISKLKRAGRVEQVAHGVWRLRGGTAG